MPLRQFSPQTPSDHIDNQFDFVDLLPSGDTLSTATVTSDDPALVISTPTLLGSMVTVWISGGTTDQYPAVITCHATTTAGRILNRSAVMAILSVVG